jgi:flagellar biosynthesis protein FliR
MNWPLEEFVAAGVLVGARVAGLMTFCPFLGSTAIPASLKAALTLLVTALLYPLHGPVRVTLSLWEWAAVALGEVVIGVVLGLAASLLVEAALLAGQILGVQMGYSLAVLFDPNTQADTPVLAQFEQLATILIFLQLNVHHWLLRAVARSFDYLPPGAAFSSIAVSSILRAAGAIFLTGAQIAAPVLSASLIVDLMLGFLGKASPQMPVLFIGLAVKNLLGLAILMAVIAFWPRLFAERFAASIGWAEQWLHLARGAAAP